MYRNAASALLLSASLSAPAFATTDVSALIRDRGLAGAEAELSAATDPDDRFALAGIVFLRAIEDLWQVRWRHGLSRSAPMAPLMETELPPNPVPEPLAATTINTAMDDLIAGMVRASDILAALPPDADPAFVISVPDLWFDVNANGARDAGEDFAELALQTLLNPWRVRRLKEELEANPDMPNPLTATVRFDAADADWLHAYTHLVRGTCEVILAFDPAPEIARTLDLRAAIASQRADAVTDAVADETRELIETRIREANPTMSDDEVAARVSEAVEEASRRRVAGALGVRRDEMAGWIDVAAIVLNTLDRQPDAAGLGRARDHLLDMVRLNRGFWQKVALETDDEGEWIPNPRQTAALGFALPDGAEESWLAVLSDAERVLKGELLIPYWRFGAGHGVDLAAWIGNPAPVSIVDWIQGTAALPYAAKGEVMSDANWRQFSRLVEGRAGLFAILLN